MPNVFDTIVVAALASLFFTSHVSAQDAFTMENAPEAGASPQVIDGVPASGSDWPATLKFSTSAGNCTSTVVGPRTVLTAAHCLPDGASGSVRVGQQSVGITCEHHPGYVDDYQLDIALCLADLEDGDIPIADDARYETINIDPNFPGIGQPVLLLGYGCRQEGGGGPSGSLYQGSAAVRNVVGSYIDTRGGAAVCFGDSGGGAYFDVTATRQRLIGVNSRGDIISRSLLTATSSPLVLSFLQSWAQDNAVDICGVTVNGGRCAN